MVNCVITPDYNTPQTAKTLGIEGIVAEFPTIVIAMLSTCIINYLLYKFISQDNLIITSLICGYPPWHVCSCMATQK